MMTNPQTKRLAVLLQTLARSIKAGQRMPPEIFDALLGIMPLMTVEVCILRRRGRTADVWLTRRSPRETRYPNIWHVPGSYLRSGERLATVLNRLERHELGGTAKFFGVKFLTVMNIPRERTGHTVSLVHWCRLRGTPCAGRWWPVNALPASVIAAHRKIIRLAVTRRSSDDRRSMR